ncbi:MAG: chalcone isomerase family protein [Candidatus Omnitrophota bacterium]|jgi:hypothetical protein
MIPCRILFWMLLAGIALSPGCGGSGSSNENNRSQTPTQHCLHRECFDNVIEIGGQKFRLSGLSLRKYLRQIHVYTAALYVPEREQGIEVLSPDAKILILRYHRKVEKEKIVESIRDNMSHLPGVNMRKVLPDLRKLEAAFTAPAKGDECRFSFFPGSGMTMAQNGTDRVTIPGNDFAEAFFGIWLSPDSGDLKMRAELLGPEAGLTPLPQLPLKERIREGFKETVVTKPVKAVQTLWRRMTSLFGGSRTRAVTTSR